MNEQATAAPVVVVTEQPGGKPGARTFDVAVDGRGVGYVTESQRMVGGTRRDKYSRATYIESFSYTATVRTHGQAEAWGLYSLDAAAKALVAVVCL